MRCSYKFTDKQDERGRFVHRCERCEAEKSSRYDDPAMLKSECSAVPRPPGLIQRMKNFVVATSNHIACGGTLVSEEVRDERLAICQGCPLLVEGICSHESCGCPIRNKSAFIDKLSWASSVCPLGKWAVDPPAGAR